MPTINTSVLWEESNYVTPTPFNIGESANDMVVGFNIFQYMESISTSIIWTGSIANSGVYRRINPTPEFDNNIGTSSGIVVISLTNGRGWAIPTGGYSAYVPADSFVDGPSGPQTSWDPYTNNSQAFFHANGFEVSGPRVGDIWFYAVCAQTLYKNGSPDTGFSDTSFPTPTLSHPWSPSWSFSLLASVAGNGDPVLVGPDTYQNFRKMWVFYSQNASRGLTSYYPTVDFSVSSGSGYYIGVYGGSENAELVSGPGSGGAGEGPWSLHDSIGQYMVSYTAGDRIAFRRSGIIAPPFETQIDSATSPGGGENDHGARFIQNQDGRLEMLFTRTSGGTDDVYRQFSDDDGDTWDIEGSPMFADATHAHVFIDANVGVTFYSAYKDGELIAKRQYAGDVSPGDQFTLMDDAAASLLVDDDQHCITVAPDSSGRWLLTALVGGTVTVYESYDDGETWKEIP